MTATETLDLRLHIRDVSNQKQAFVNDVPPDATVGELIRGLLPEMQLPRSDGEGRPLVYQALHEREGRHLNATERVVDVVQPGDRVVLQPNIDAGSC